MTAPPFILSPTSLTEFPAYWGERPELFADIARGKDEAERAERVLRWFICTLKGQYTVGFVAGSGRAGGGLMRSTLVDRPEMRRWDPKRNLLTRCSESESES